MEITQKTMSKLMENPVCAESNQTNDPFTTNSIMVELNCSGKGYNSPTSLRYAYKSINKIDSKIILLFVLCEKVADDDTSCKLCCCTFR